jgi:hypothetical protein
VRCISGQDERKQPKYRLFQVVGELGGESNVLLVADRTGDDCCLGLTGEERKYEMEDRGRNIMENRRLQLRYGKVTRPYKMAEVSNSKLSEVRSRRLCLPKRTKVLNRPRFFDASPNFVDGKRPWIPMM